jgi:tetratricopeptide (TPR) repeat protein
MYRISFILLLTVGFGAPNVLAQNRIDTQAELRASRLLVRGMTMLHSGDVASARASLEMALHLSPNNATVLAALAEAYTAAGNTQEALHYAARALTVDPSDPENARLLAERYAADRNINAGVDALERHSRASPGLSSSLLLITFLANHGRSADALREVRNVLEISAYNSALIEATLAVTPDDISSADRLSLLSELMRAGGDQSLVIEVLSDSRLSDGDVTRLLSMLRRDFPGIGELITGAAIHAANGMTEPAGQPSRSVDDADALEWYDRAIASPRSVETWAMASKRLLETGRAGLAHELARDAATFFRVEMTSPASGSAVRWRSGIVMPPGMLLARRSDTRRPSTLRMPSRGPVTRIALGDEAAEFLESVEPDGAVARIVAFAHALARDGRQMIAWSCDSCSSTKMHSARRQS